MNKLRDDLGVKLDFTDDADDKEKDSKKKKAAAPGSKARVKVHT